MTKIKNVLLASLAACLLIALPLAHAYDQGPDVSSQMKHPGQRIQRIYDQLDLTDDQKKQLEDNKQQHRAKMEISRRQMKAEQQALHAELMSPQLDMPKINATHARIKALQSQMEDDKLSSILAVRTILTPEQFTKFVNLMHRHKS